MAHTAHHYRANIPDGAANEDTLKACSGDIARAFRMRVEDGRHIFGDYQEMAQKFATEEMHAAGYPEPGPRLDFAQEPRVTH